MRSHFYSLASVLVFNIFVSVPAAHSAKFCPLLGPAFPSPLRLTSNDRFQAATASFDAALNNKLKAEPFNTTTFSIGMFSTSEPGLVYERHYTDPSVADGDVGTKKADADSVYRIGSISKLLTVYLFLIHVGDQRFSDPVTKYIPELAAAAFSNADSPNGETPDWNEITIGQLASHMGGLAHDCRCNSEGCLNIF
jgi:CubicO group peptidase (beta-lactamase class C family)